MIAGWICEHEIFSYFDVLMFAQESAGMVHYDASLFTEVALRRSGAANTPVRFCLLHIKE